MSLIWVTLSSVVPYIGTWIETEHNILVEDVDKVVPYIGTWIETPQEGQNIILSHVVPYIGTWIETFRTKLVHRVIWSYLI